MRVEAGRRLAVYLDLENLLFAYTEAGQLALGLARIGIHLSELAKYSTIVGITAVCNHFLYRAIVDWAQQQKMRVHLHNGGLDAADIELCRRLTLELPASVDGVVLGSGDIHFLSPVVELGARGLRVELIAPSGGLSSQLKMAVDAVRLLPAPKTPLQVA